MIAKTNNISTKQIVVESDVFPQEGRIVKVSFVKTKGNAKGETFEGIVCKHYPHFILFVKQDGTNVRNTFQKLEFINKHVIFKYLD